MGSLNPFPTNHFRGTFHDAFTCARFTFADMWFRRIAFAELSLRVCLIGQFTWNRLRSSFLFPPVVFTKERSKQKVGVLSCAIGAFAECIWGLMLCNDRHSPRSRAPNGSQTLLHRNCKHAHPRRFRGGLFLNHFRRKLSRPAVLAFVRPRWGRNLDLKGF